MEKLSPNAAIEALSFFAKRLSPLLELAPKLEAISSLEAYSAELKNEIEKSKDEVASLAEVIQASRTTLDVESKKAEETLEDAKLEAHNLVKDAKAESEGILSTARGKAEEIVDDAARKSSDILAKIDKKVGEVEALDKKISEKSKALADLETAINSIKAKF